jgi:hypothetical protein
MAAPDSAPCCPRKYSAQARERFHVPYVEVSTGAPDALRLRYVASSFLTSLGKTDD